MNEEKTLLHVLTLKVRWGDMDALGHINNAAYFVYCEQARIEAIAAMDPGRDHMARGNATGPVVVSAALDFHLPVVHPATLDIHVSGGPPGRSSFKTYYEIRDHDAPERLYSSGTAQVVWADLEQGRSVPLPETIRSRLTG